MVAGRSKTRDWSIPALVVAALLCAAAAPGAGSHALATCSPIANVPSVDSGSHTGQATGKGLCDAGAPSWLYTVRLVNRAGSALAETSGGPFSGTHQVGTSTVSCAGAYVHTYLYINVGGTGKSDTSGESSACVLAAPALGGSGVPFFGDGTDTPSVEPGRLQRAVSLRMPDGDVAALWVAPTTEGGRCVILNVGPDGSAAAPSTVANGGGWCARPPLGGKRAPIAATVNWINPAGGRFEVLLAGQVSPASGIARMELRSAAGVAPLPLTENLFLGALPSSGAAGRLAGGGGPYVLVGRDRAGAEVASLDLAGLLAASRP